MFGSPSTSFILLGRNHCGITLRMSDANLLFCTGFSNSLLSAVLDSGCLDRKTIEIQQQLQTVCKQF